MRDASCLVICLLVWTLVTCSCLGEDVHQICSTRCCSSCDELPSVTCHCPNRRLVIGNESIPNTIESLHVVDADVVTIKENALHSSPSLRELELRNINRLVLKPDAFNLPENSKLRNVNLTHILSVEVHGTAISGWWDSSTNFGMNAVNNLKFHQSAVNHSSSLAGPILRLEGINGLRLAPKSLNSQIKRLTMKNVRMDICHEDSFTGNIDHLTMDGVKIVDTQKHCIALPHSSTLDIKNSNFKHIHAEGISGKVKHVQIVDSSFWDLQGKGISMQVDRLGIHSSRFRTLDTGALDVKANSSVVLQNVTVGILRPRALFDITTSSTAGANSTLSINGLNITHAENSSLALSEHVKASVTNLHVNISQSDCYAKELFWLVGKSSASALTPAEEGILHQLGDPSQCPSPKPTPPIAAPTSPTPDRRLHDGRPSESHGRFSTPPGTGEERPTPTAATADVAHKTVEMGAPKDNSEKAPNSAAASIGTYWQTVVLTSAALAWSFVTSRVYSTRL